LQTFIDELGVMPLGLGTPVDGSVTIMFDNLPGDALAGELDGPGEPGRGRYRSRCRYGRLSCVKKLMVIGETQNVLLPHIGLLSTIKGVIRSATRELTGMRRVP
jgi:hypothetical protein